MPSTPAQVPTQRPPQSRTATPTFKRSGITRLSTPSGSDAVPVNGQSNGLSGRTTNGTSSKAAHVSHQREVPRGAPTASTTTLVSSMPAPVEHAPKTAPVAAEERRVHSPSHVPAQMQWRRGVMAVCQRLEAAVQETELILMRAVPTAADATTAAAAAARSLPSHSTQHRTTAFEELRNPFIDPSVPTPAQTLEAVQRYRGGCLAALLQLNALLMHVPQEDAVVNLVKARGAANASTQCDVRRGHAKDAAGGDEEMVAAAVSEACSVTSAAPTKRTAEEVENLQRSYRVLEEHLSETLATQAAYMQAVALQQSQRERDGVLGEHMWTLRLLVEQEAAERTHIVHLRAYVQRTLLQTTTAKQLKTSGSGSVNTAAAAARTQRPTQDAAEAASRLAAERDALLRELHQQRARTDALLAAQMRDAQAAHARALSQMAARHDAEKQVWEMRVQVMQTEMNALQQRCETALVAQQGAEVQRGEAQHSAAEAQSQQQQQLKSATKKMWQLQLANDHLDAKVRVLQRELEDVRVSRSPLQRRPSPLPEDGDDGHGHHERHRTSTPALIGVPAAARMARGEGAATPRGGGVVPTVPRLPDPPVQWRMDDVRHGLPLHRDSGKEGGGQEGSTVRPSVWLAYEERNLLSSATPIKSRRDVVHRDSLDEGPAIPPRWMMSGAAATYAWEEAAYRLSIHTSRRTSLLPSFPLSPHSAVWRAPASTPQRRGTLMSHASCMSEDVAAVGEAGEERVQCRPLRPPRPPPSPTRRQLSLEETPTVGPHYPPSTIDSPCLQGHHVDTASEKDTFVDQLQELVEEEEELQAPDWLSAPPMQPYRHQRQQQEQQKSPPPTQQQQELLLLPPRASSPPPPPPPPVEEKVVRYRRTPSPSPLLAPRTASTPPSSRSHAHSDGEEDAVYPPLTAPHGAVVTSLCSPSPKGSETESEEEEEDEDEDEEDSTATLPPSARARLENVRREILRHTETLERDVQDVTARHDAAQRQRRRERGVIRVNAAAQRGSPAVLHHHHDNTDSNGNNSRDDAGAAAEGEESGHTSDVDRALEKLHIAQQEDDDQLAQYYAEVNRKRGELERCLRVVEERLAPRQTTDAADTD